MPTDAIFSPKYFDAMDERYLSEKDIGFRDHIRKFIAVEIQPRIIQWLKDAKNEQPHNNECSAKEILIRTIMKQFGALGVLGCAYDLSAYVPDSQKVSPYAYGAIMREIEASDSAWRSCASVQSALVIFAILTFGSKEQKKQWLQRLYRGEKIGAFGLTEPHGGSDPRRILASARIDGNSFILNGTKNWITNAGIADIIVVWAKLDGLIRGFLIEVGTTGAEKPDKVATRNENKWAFPLGIASQITLSNCRIPKSNILPCTIQPENKDLIPALRCLNEARFGINWGVIGPARRCFEKTLEFTQERELFGKSLAQKQITQVKLAKMFSRIRLAQLVAYDLAKLKKNGGGKIDYREVSYGKYNNVNAALRVAELACELKSADVFSEEDEIGRHLRNLMVVRKYEGDHEIHGLIVGEAITGETAF